MQEGLLVDYNLPNGGTAQLWCVKHRPEDSFTNANDVAVVKFRFTAYRMADKEKSVRRRFRKMYPEVLPKLEGENTVMEFYCEMCDDSLWNTLLIHCLTKDAVEFVVNTLSTDIKKPAS